VRGWYHPRGPGNVPLIVRELVEDVSVVLDQMRADAAGRW
jgi:hypothetical protein